jgi:hypothetical protein
VVSGKGFGSLRSNEPRGCSRSKAGAQEKPLDFFLGHPCPRQHRPLVVPSTAVFSEKKSYFKSCEGDCAHRASDSSSIDFRLEEITVGLIIALASSAVEAGPFHSLRFACLSGVGRVVFHVCDPRQGAHSFSGWMNVRAESGTFQNPNGPLLLWRSGPFGVEAPACVTLWRSARRDRRPVFQWRRPQ